MDYILFIKANVDLDVNPNEIRDVKYVTPEELKAMFADSSKYPCWSRLSTLTDLIDMLGVPMTPWFKLICNSFLFKWWDQLDTIESVKADDTIHRLGF